MAKRPTLDHPKFARLQIKLGVSKFATLGILETLWQFAGRYTPEGNVGKYSDEEIEAWIGWTDGDGVLVQTLIECGWLDRDDEYRLIIHDWADHVDHTTSTALKRAGLSPITRRPPNKPPKREQNLQNTPETGNQLERCSNTVRTLCAPPEPEPEPEPEPLPPPPTPSPSSPRSARTSAAVVVATESPPRFELDRQVDELYELYPPDRRGRSPSRDKAKIRACLAVAGAQFADHSALVLAGIRRLLACLDSGYDRKLIPGFEKFFLGAAGSEPQWRDEWLPLESRNGHSGREIVMLWDPGGHEVGVYSDEVEGHLASGWSSNRPKGSPSRSAVSEKWPMRRG